MLDLPLKSRLMHFINKLLEILKKYSQFFMVPAAPQIWRNILVFGAENVEKWWFFCKKNLLEVWPPALNISELYNAYINIWYYLYAYESFENGLASLDGNIGIT